MSDDSNLSPDEERQALDPTVGDGAPDTAPWTATPTGAPSWLPTRKWWAAFTGAVASVIASWIVTGAFDDVERGMVGTAIVALAAAYWQSNDPTLAGVPER